MQLKSSTPRRVITALTGVGALAVSAVLAVPAQAVTTDAIEDLAICTLNSVPRNDDGSAWHELGFTLNFFGESYDSLYVNNNGNVTFDYGLRTYTPGDLTGPTGIPMIAPFFADIDTRNAADGAKQVTYGSDDNTLCVNWVDVGFYDARVDKRISAQLIIEDRSQVTGVVGDIKITFNYSDIGWETGNASGGIDGFGGTPVAVGYTAGTGEPGTFTQFTGSLVRGALVDGGPHALTAGSRNSDVLGRYIFYSGGSDVVLEGAIVGTVLDADGQPLENAVVTVCDDTADCLETRTNAAGAYSLVGVPVGDYLVRAEAPANLGLVPALKTASVTAGQTETVDLQLSWPTVTVYDVDRNPLADVLISVCQGDAECVEVGNTPASGTLFITGITGGPYEVFATPAPDAGLLANSYRVDAPVDISFTLQPATESGIVVHVVDETGEAIEGAEVVLSRAGGQQIAEGSPLLAPGSSNPAQTNAEGLVIWTVAELAYELAVTADECRAVTGVEVGEFVDGRAEVRVEVDCAPEPEPQPEVEEPETPVTPEPTPPTDGDDSPVVTPTTPDEGVLGIGVEVGAEVGGDELPQTGFDARIALVALAMIAAGAVLAGRRLRFQR